MRARIQSVGIDIVPVKRFAPFARKRSHAFLKKVFTRRELDHCFSYAAPAESLAGTFVAKEAASKALGVAKFPFAELEIRRRKDGAPEVWKNGKRVAVAVSITHAGGIAAAVAAR
jgi:holo-[acyl-carrier protein] synthase